MPITHFIEIWLNTINKGDDNRMTNEEWIRSMNHEELAKFLYSLEESEFPWYDEFDKEICIPLCNRDTCLGLDCPYGDPIEWWLGQTVEGGK